MRFAISNTQNGLMIYIDDEALIKLGQHLAVNTKGKQLIVRKGGGLHIHDNSKTNKSLIPHSGTILSGQPYANMPLFGKTEFEFVETEDAFVIDLEKPVGDYKKPRNVKSKQVEDVLTSGEPSRADIQNAVILINSLSRDSYRVLLDTTTNNISVKREEIFA